MQNRAIDLRGYGVGGRGSGVVRGWWGGGGVSDNRLTFSSDLHVI